MSENPYVSYFQPGQIVFLVEGRTTPEENTQFLEWAKTNLPQGVEISAKDADSMQFPPLPPILELKYAETASKVPITRKPEKPSVEVKPSVFTLVPAQITGLKGEKEGDLEIQLFNLILGLDKKRQNAKGKPLRAVSPNWFITGSSSSPGGTGGPGSRPDAYDGSPETHEHEFDLQYLPPAIRDQVQTGKKGTGIDVAILDTAPVQSLKEIDDYWVKVKKHTLLSRLRDPSNPRLLEIVKDSGADTPSRLNKPFPPGYRQSNDDGHDYEMADHGLFAAGIINSFAPAAKIRLFQVLNPYGIGDLTSIARGLQRVLASYTNGNNLLVNMSLTINFPLEKAHITTEDPVGKMIGEMILNQKRPGWVDWLCQAYNWLCMLIEKIFGISLPRCPLSWYERQTWAMEGICDSLKELGSKVIAAAGNRRRNGAGRPQAEYPAAFPDVLGVGALPRKSEPPADPNTRLPAASYSNFSDRPDGSGIATLGGEEGLGNGVLGIYLGKFPGRKDSIAPPTPSANGWAWWAGTSFATPIVTGITAAVLSNGTLGDTPKKVIESLLKNRSYWTEQNEEVLFVRQCLPSSTTSNTPPYHAA